MNTYTNVYTHTHTHIETRIQICSHIGKYTNYGTTVLYGRFYKSNFVSDKYIKL